MTKYPVLLKPTHRRCFELDLILSFFFFFVLGAWPGKIFRFGPFCDHQLMTCDMLPEGIKEQNLGQCNLNLEI